MVDIQALTKRYKDRAKPAVDGLSLGIERGSIFGLLGPNGAGKTTLISMLCGLFPPDSGSIRINGLDLRTETPACKQLLGVVPQEIALYSRLTAWENLNFLGHMYGLKGEALRESIRRNLAVMGLEANMHQKIESYSGGMKRRVNLIAGILHNPELLILDEPTVGVDIQSKQAIIDHLKQLNREQGMTILYTSHHLSEAEDFCTHIAIIDEGKLIVEGPTNALIEAHQSKNIEEVYLHHTGDRFRD